MTDERQHRLQFDAVMRRPVPANQAPDAARPTQTTDGLGSGQVGDTKYGITNGLTAVTVIACRRDMGIIAAMH